VVDTHRTCHEALGTVLDVATSTTDPTLARIAGPSANFVVERDISLRPACTGLMKTLLQMTNIHVLQPLPMVSTPIGTQIPE
jgi:hypothetical protein